MTAVGGGVDVRLERSSGQESEHYIRERLDLIHKMTSAVNVRCVRYSVRQHLQCGCIGGLGRMLSVKERARHS